MTRHIVKSPEPQEPATEWNLIDGVHLRASRDDLTQVVARITRDGRLQRFKLGPIMAGALGIPLDASGRIAMEE